MIAGFVVVWAIVVAGILRILLPLLRGPVERDVPVKEQCEIRTCERRRRGEYVHAGTPVLLVCGQCGEELQAVSGGEFRWDG